jgi:hypothetical protein
MGYITKAYGYAGTDPHQPHSVGFVFTKDGKTTDTGLLSDRDKTPNFTASFSGQVLGTVTVMGTFDKVDTQLPHPSRWVSANCVVFGWRLLSSYASPRQSVPATWVGQGTPNQACGKAFTATAPPGSGIADVTLGGAGGGGSTFEKGNRTAGGAGAEVTAEFAVQPGQSVTFIAGCGGATPYLNSPGSGGAGFAHGGNGGAGPNSNYYTGGAGGGSSALCLGSGSTCSVALAIVSGGGGAGAENDCQVDDSAGNGGGGFSESLSSSSGITVLRGSGGADQVAGGGASVLARGGGGGTDTQPGSGGAGFSNQNGQPGSGVPGASTGGAGAKVQTGRYGGGGGGGGGGYLSGGGGGGDTCRTGSGAAAGGGAGSSAVVTKYLTPGTMPQWLNGASGGLSAKDNGEKDPVSCPALGGTLTSSGCPGYIQLDWLSSSVETGNG